jgi:hypothetical protein
MPTQWSILRHAIDDTSCDFPYYELIAHMLWVKEPKSFWVFCMEIDWKKLDSNIGEIQSRSLIALITPYLS